MHAFGFEPSFECFAGIRAELGEHLSFDHIYEDAFSTGRAAALHALGKRLRALAREASERVLREIAWHESSCESVGIQVFHRRRRTCTRRRSEIILASLNPLAMKQCNSPSVACILV